MTLKEYLSQLALLDLEKKQDVLLERFLKEMQFGLRADNASLPMIPTYVKVENIPNYDRLTSACVIDAGGTNLRTAIFSPTLDENKRLKNFTKEPMPGSKEEWSLNDYHQRILDTIKNHLGEQKKIGFCFSYPSIITPDFDAELIKWTKEIKIPELVGKLIGKELTAYAKKQGINLPPIRILNDTVATLMAGKLKEKNKKNYSSYIGFILGTGLNCAYVDKSVNVLKILDEVGTQVINMEAGSYLLFPRNKIDEEIDKTTTNPGEYHFEKMVGGVYFGKLCLMALKNAKELMSAQTHQILSEIDYFSLIELSDVLEGKTPSIFAQVSSDDLETIRSIIAAFTKRSILYCAILLSACILKSGEGLSADKPICINIDGSTVNKTFGFRKKLIKKVEEILSGENKRFVDFVSIEHSPLLGAGMMANIK